MTELEDLRLQWAALAVEDLSLLPQAALIASIRNLAQELLDRTEDALATPRPGTRLTPQRPVDADHALRVGQVAGLLGRYLAEDGPIRAAQVEVLDDDEGRHLDTVRVHAPSGTYLVAVIKESEDVSATPTPQ